jgi:hypothetical protein
MAATMTPGANAPGRAAARLAWLAEKAAVGKRYRAYAQAWVQQQIDSMEQRGEIPADQSLDEFVELRRDLFSRVPEYDDATGKARQTPQESQP